MLSSKISQPVKDQIVEPGQRTNSLILGERPSVRCPAAPFHLRQRPYGLRQPLANRLHARDKRRCHPPMPGIITHFPFAGWIVPLFFELLCAFPSDFTSTWGVFDAALADLFRVAIFWPLPQ